MHFLKQQIVVCSECKIGVLPDYINIYLTNKNTHNMRKKARNRVIQKVKQIPGLIQQKSGLNSINFFPANNSFIPKLQKLRHDSMKCQFKDLQSKSC